MGIFFQQLAKKLKASAKVLQKELGGDRKTKNNNLIDALSHLNVRSQRAGKSGENHWEKIRCYAYPRVLCLAKKNSLLKNLKLVCLNHLIYSGELNVILALMTTDYGRFSLSHLSP